MRVLMRQKSDVGASGLKKFPDLFQPRKFYLFIKVRFKSYLFCAVFPDCSVTQRFPIFLNSGHMSTVFWPLQCFVSLPLIHYLIVKDKDHGFQFFLNCPGTQD